MGVMSQCTCGGQRTLVRVCPSTAGSMDLMRACLYLLDHLKGLRIKDYFHLKTKREYKMAPIGSCFRHSGFKTSGTILKVLELGRRKSLVGAGL